MIVSKHEDLGGDRHEALLREMRKEAVSVVSRLCDAAREESRLPVIVTNYAGGFGPR